MAIRLTLVECLMAEPALARIASLPWPVKTAYHLSKLLRTLRREVKFFEEQRLAAVRNFGTGRTPSDEEKARGQVEDIHQVQPDRMGEYVARYRELEQLPIQIDLYPITLEQLAGDQRVTGTDLADLGPLLEQGDTVEANKPG